MPGSITSRVSPSLVRSASDSMIPLTPLTPLARQVRACSNGVSATEPRLAHRSDAGELMVNFTIIHAREARDALFANGRDPRGASALFLKSGNRYAKEEVTQFAKVYHQLKQQRLSPEDNKQLDTLASKYVDKMVNDGLGSKSGFGAWTHKTNKCYQQRNKLEHSLAEIASKVCGDKYERLADSLLPEVTQFILSSIEAELGRPLEDGSLNTVMGLIDNRAKQAWESLRGYRTELLQERGAGVGKLSRDLDTVAILPELLRKLLPAIAEQLKQDSVHPQTGTNSQPDAADGKTHVAGSHQPGITINVGGIHINRDDHHVNRDDHSDRRHYSTPADAGQPRSSATATANASGGLASGAASEMGSQTSALKYVLTKARVVDFRPEVATSEPIHRLKPEIAISSTDRPQPDVIAGSTDSSKGDLHDAARQVANTLTELIKTTEPSAVATSATRSTLVTPSVTEISSDVDSSSKLNPESLQLPNINGNLNTEANKATRNESVAGQVDWEGLRLQGQLKTLPNENVLKGSDFQYGDNAAWELIHAARGVLSSAPALSVTQRTAYDRWLNKILPNKITAQANLPSGQDQLPRLSELLKHPDIVQFRPKLESFVRQMLRVTNLGAYSERPVIRALLDGLDVSTKKAVSTSVADPQVATAQGLHNAARQVASALTGLIETAKPSAVATSTSRTTPVTPTLTERTLSHLSSSSTQSSLIGTLNNGEPMGRASQQPVIVSKDGASASVTAGLGIEDTAPPRLVKELEDMPTKVRSDWSGLRFESVLPSRLNGASLRDQASAQRELVRGLRMFMQPGAAVPLAMRREFEALRDNVLPSDPLLYSDRLKRLETEGGTADHQQLSELSNLMKDQRFGFKSQRAQAAQFASRLIRNTDLLKGKPHAMINQLLEGVGITSDEAKRLQMTSVASQNSRVVLSELGALTRDLLSRPLETNKGIR